MAFSPPPRLCHIVKRPSFDGYGFNLHAEKNKAGQFVGKVDPGSPAEAAGLQEGDRIIEVNGANVNQENHKQVVQRIRNVDNETRVLVVDKHCDDWHKDKKKFIRSTLDYVVHISSEDGNLNSQDTIEDDDKMDDLNYEEDGLPTNIRSPSPLHDRAETPSLYKSDVSECIQEDKNDDEDTPGDRECKIEDEGKITEAQMNTECIVEDNLNDNDIASECNNESTEESPETKTNSDAENISPGGNEKKTDIEVSTEETKEVETEKEILIEDNDDDLERVTNPPSMITLEEEGDKETIETIVAIEDEGNSSSTIGLEDSNGNVEEFKYEEDTTKDNHVGLEKEESLNENAYSDEIDDVRDIVVPQTETTDDIEMTNASNDKSLATDWTKQELDNNSSENESVDSSCRTEMRLDLPITAKEMREMLISRKKRDIRMDDRMDFRMKHQIIQTL